MVVLGLAIALAYCQRPEQPPTSGGISRPDAGKTTPSVQATEAKNAAPDHPGHLAVADLNKIAEDTGQRSKIEEASQVRDRNLQISMRALQQRVQTNLKTLAEEIGARPQPKGNKPTAAEQKLIGEWVRKMQKLEQSRMDADNRIRRAHEQQRQVNQMATRAEITKIRDSIAPLAQRIAAAKGLDVVVTRSSVLAHSKAVDITAEVLKEVQKLIKAGSFPTVTIPEPAKVTP